MSLTRSLAVFRHEVRLMRQQSANLLQLLFIPMIMMVFLKGVSRYPLAEQGYRDANGSEQVVPGMTLMFGFFLCGSVAFAFFMEHGWGTWERLRASPARPAEILLGKSMTPWALVVLQQVLLFAFGIAVLGLRVQGSFLALGLVAAAFGLPLVGYGVLLAAFCRRVQEVNLISSLLAMVFAGLGGAFFAPVALPAWARVMGQATPTYWAMSGYRSVILDGAGVGRVLAPCAVLLVMGIVVGGVGLVRFRFEETKVVVG